jgi:hypothetical protein
MANRTRNPQIQEQGGGLTVGSTNSPTRSGFLNMAFTAASAWVTTAISSSSRAFCKGVSLSRVEGGKGGRIRGRLLGGISHLTPTNQFHTTTYRVLPGMRSVLLVGGHLLVPGANARQGCSDRRHTTPINMIDVQVEVDEEEEPGAFSLLRHPHPAEATMATAS